MRCDPGVRPLKRGDPSGGGTKDITRTTLNGRQSRLKCLLFQNTVPLSQTQKQYSQEWIERVQEVQAGESKKAAFLWI